MAAFSLKAATALFLLASPDNSFALDSLAVGRNTLENSSAGSWLSKRASSSSLGIAADSVWMWDVEPNTNLVASLDRRDGAILEVRAGLFGNTVQALAGGELVADGDGATVFDPDEATPVPLARTTPIYIDLGGNFQVNRVRFFPRLDGRHDRRFLQEFEVATSPTVLSTEGFASLFAFFPSLPNTQPVVDKRFDSRNMRYVRITPTSERQWEIAEIEVYGDGSLPTGEFVSEPLRMRSANSVFGEMRLTGVNDPDARIVVQTRAGPDASPDLYFVLSERGSEPVEVSREDYFSAPPDSQAAIRHNPAWSDYEAVTDNVVLSSGIQAGRSHLQFRLRMSKPDTKLERISFEVISPPLVRSVVAEISPTRVEAGVDTTFTLSMVAHMRTDRLAGNDTGFDFVQIKTAAEIERIERVLVDDSPAGFSVERDSHGHPLIHLSRRIEQDGSFLQIVFRGRAFRDQTSVHVRIIDKRVVDSRQGAETVTVEETGYQIATAGEADEETVSESLTITLINDGNRVPLLSNVTVARAFSPNGDGINDMLDLSYSLLTLTKPAPVVWRIYDLSGRRVRVVQDEQKDVGNHSQVWDGLDEGEELVVPGIYLFEVEVRADAVVERVRGTMAVIY